MAANNCITPIGVISLLVLSGAFIVFNQRIWVFRKLRYKKLGIEKERMLNVAQYDVH